MIKWTTPTLSVSIPSGLEFDYLIFTLEGKNNQIDKRIEVEEVVDDEFSVTYTQEETGSFALKEIIKAQINFIQGDVRYASDIKYISFGLNLIDEVVE